MIEYIKRQDVLDLLTERIDSVSAAMAGMPSRERRSQSQRECYEVWSAQKSAAEEILSAVEELPAHPVCDEKG